MTQRRILIDRSSRIGMPMVMVTLVCTPLSLGPMGLSPAPAYAAITPQDPPPATQAPPPTADDARQLMEEQQFDEARQAWEAIVKADPDNGEAWFQLGYCQIVTGLHEPSIDSFRKSIEFNFQARTAMYNLACANSVLGNVDEGFTWLHKAINAGFDRLDLLDTDSDLANLRKDPRFEKLPRTPGAIRPERARAVTFSAADGVTIYGDLYEAAAPRSAPIILLFHQGGSNKAEYYLIAPRLVEMGFHCLAIDARSGASRFGHTNETARGMQERQGMMDAYADLVAALKHVRDSGFTGPVTAWGSSYSAGLVLKLAAEHPDDIVAVLSFSPPAPGSEAMGREGYDPDQWASAAKKTAIFITWPPGEMNESRRAFFDSIQSDCKQLFAQEDGVHGSSTLHEASNAQGWEANWKPVIAFLVKYSHP